MERNLHEPEIYDFRQHDRLWQRVGPGLEPYPETTAEAMPRREELPPAQESLLPGAEPNPCCMGSEAMELLAVLEGYIEEELEDRRRYLALSRQAPSWARQTLRDMAEEENGHARRLMAARYLITGQPYRPNLVCGVFCPGRWAEELRRSYHEEACSGLNYARTADGTTDVCLVKLLNELSEDEYRHAERLMALLERSLGRQGRNGKTPRSRENGFGALLLPGGLCYTIPLELIRIGGPCMYDELTAVDIQKMQEEINYRVRELRPQLIEEVQTARAFGDLSENYEYKCAKQAKNRNDSRIRYLERMIRTAKVIEVKETADAVGLFDTVTVYNEMMKKEMIVRIVTTLRQDALKGLISKESPVGQALMGRRTGERVEVAVSPEMKYTLEIRKIEKGSDDESLDISSY